MSSIQKIHQEMKREAQRHIFSLTHEGSSRPMTGNWDPVLRPYVL